MAAAALKQGTDTELRTLLEEQKEHVASLLGNLGSALAGAATAEVSAEAARLQDADAPPPPP